MCSNPLHHTLLIDLNISVSNYAATRISSSWPGRATDYTRRMAVSHAFFPLTLPVLPLCDAPGNHCCSIHTCCQPFSHTRTQTSSIGMRSTVLSTSLYSAKELTAGVPCSRETGPVSPAFRVAFPVALQAGSKARGKARLHARAVQAYQSKGKSPSLVATCHIGAVRISVARRMRSWVVNQ